MYLAFFVRDLSILIYLLFSTLNLYRQRILILLPPAVFVSLFVCLSTGMVCRSTDCIFLSYLLLLLLWMLFLYFFSLARTRHSHTLTQLRADGDRSSSRRHHPRVWLPTRVPPCHSRLRSQFVLLFPSFFYSVCECV